MKSAGIAVGCVIAATVAVAGLVAPLLWGGRHVGDQRMWEIAATAVAGPVLVALIGALTSVLVWRFFAEGSRVTALLLVAPLPYAGASRFAR